MKVIIDRQCLLHDTIELLGSRVGNALESPARLETIINALPSDDKPPHYVKKFIQEEDRDNEPDTAAEILSSTHDEGLLAHLATIHATWVQHGLIEEHESVLPECFPLPWSSSGDKSNVPPKDQFARAGFYAFDLSSGLMKHSWTSIRASAMLANRAAEEVSGPKRSADSIQDRESLALCRPPGHHCTTKKVGGYCYVNNAVVAVETIRRRHSSAKIAILDLDFHHGNGTQDYYYEDPGVLYVSIHGKDEYPYYSGFEDETGKGAGVGFNVNLPLETRATFEQYLEKVDVLVKRTQEFAPDYIVVSLGFDTFRNDPLGSFQIDTGDYETMARKIRGADGLQSIPTVILLVSNPVVILAWTTIGC
jgi:acetoin utilization deacetylase AcuC-like enzyme